MSLRLGLGLKIGSEGASASAPIFDPLTLAPIFWQRGSYAGSPWADASGNGHTFTEAVTPATVGTVVNGFASADFDGIAKSLHSGVDNNVLFGASLSLWVLFYARTAPAPSGVIYRDGSLLTDFADADTSFGFTTDGVNALINTAAGYKRIDVACAPGAWKLAQFKLGGGFLRGRVNGGLRTSLACGATSFAVPAALYMGTSYGGTTRLDGLILDIGGKDAALSDADEDNILAYARARYGLALT